jgi:hypothetical protein
MKGEKEMIEPIIIDVMPSRGRHSYRLTTSELNSIGFGNIIIDLKTGEVTGLSDDISADANAFWSFVGKYVVGK